LSLVGPPSIWVITSPALAWTGAARRSAFAPAAAARATSDIDDVAPSALRRAGGRVERFGMPVDPGNLLFLGRLGNRPVIGLPGCARSPALNGADWVLSRVACGIEVTGDDIAGMGVGGLLKEIPTRPQPRAGRAAPDKG
jgi:molybdenum cofactor cytidylyltransferase